MSRTRLLALLLLAAALVYAVGGWEYGTLDWLTLRRKEREEREAVARLQAEVDSLQRYLHGVETDPQVQERIAREEFGMIRKGEFLYRIESDSEPGP